MTVCNVSDMYVCITQLSVSRTWFFPGVMEWYIFWPSCNFFVLYCNLYGRKLQYLKIHAYGLLSVWSHICNAFMAWLPPAYCMDAMFRACTSRIWDPKKISFLIRLECLLQSSLIIHNILMKLKKIEWDIYETNFNLFLYEIKY